MSDLEEHCSDESGPESLTYLDWGHYHEQIQRYLDLFPKEQLKVMLIDDMIKDPGKQITDMVSFLELDGSRNQFKGPIHVNKAGGLINKKAMRYRGWKLCRSLHKRRMLAQPLWRWANDHLVPRTRGSEKPKLSDELRQVLCEYYQPGIASLAEFLGRDLSHWK